MSSIRGEHRKAHVPHVGHNPPPHLYDSFHRLVGLGSYHRRLVEQAGICSSQRVLEIGCGTGNLAILVKRLHPGAEVVGLDADPKALARAKRKGERAGLSVRLDRGFVEELPYPDASFDRVLSAFMFHHLGPDEKRRTLREVRRVLEPGGSLHLLGLGGRRDTPTYRLAAAERNGGGYGDGRDEREDGSAGREDRLEVDRGLRSGKDRPGSRGPRPIRGRSAG